MWNVSSERFLTLETFKGASFFIFSWILNYRKKEPWNFYWREINLKLFRKFAAEKKCVYSGTLCIIHFGRIELSTLKFKNRQERLARHDKYAALPLRHLQPRRGRPICAWISWTSASHAREGRTRKKKKRERKKTRSKWKLRKSRRRAEVQNSTKVLSFKNGKTPLQLCSGSRESLNRFSKTR